MNWSLGINAAQLLSRSDLVVIEHFQTMDILDRAVVSWVGTAAGTSVEMIGDALVDDSQRAGRCTGYDDRPVTARP